MAAKHPLDEKIFDEDIVILGRKGMGKTYAAMGMVAHLVETGRQVVVVDPLSVWWGLKHGRDVNEPGLPLIHCGDDEAEVPLDASMGEVIAKFILTGKHSVIVEVGHLLREEQIGFMLALLSTLFHGKRKQSNPLWLVLEEADEFAPQHAGQDMGAVLAQVRRIARQGRVRGFRIFSVTQRTATVNKNLISQLSTLISFQLVAPQDTNVLEAWLDHNGDEEGRQRVLETVKQLGKGEAWVWSHTTGALQRVKFPENKTFDSTRTPEARITATPPAQISADVLSDVREQIATLKMGGEVTPPPEPSRRGRKRKRRATAGAPFGEAIRSARVRARKSQTELAKAAGIDQGNIAALESGKGNPTYKTLLKLGEAMDHELIVSYARKPSAGWDDVPE